MSKNEWVTPIVILGALAIGGYALYNYLKNTPIGAAADAIGGGVGQVLDWDKQFADAKTATWTGIQKGAELAVKNIPNIPKVVQIAAIDAPGATMSAVSNKVMDTFVGVAKAVPSPLKELSIVAGLAASGKLITGALSSPTKAKTAESRTVIPIVAKSTTTGAINILKPLEIVKTGKAVKATLQAAKREGKQATVTTTSPIAFNKTVTVTKTLGVPTKIAISKITKS